jgi:SAM-dependent methyltransferase
MVEQGLQIGVNWRENAAKLENFKSDLQIEYQKLNSPSVEYPGYYLKPFHAYDEGNLSWDAAMEVESAALTVHARVFSSDVTTRGLRCDGDANLRNNFHLNMLEAFREQSFSPTSILDLGCSTGLSTLKLRESFPLSRIIGLDLSPYYLAGALLSSLSRFKSCYSNSDFGFTYSG